LDALVVQAHKGQVVYHVSRDSTAIAVREKAVKKAVEKKEKKRKGRCKRVKNALKPG
jgi:hypothetical protein